MRCYCSTSDSSTSSCPARRLNRTRRRYEVSVHWVILNFIHPPPTPTQPSYASNMLWFATARTLLKESQLLQFCRSCLVTVMEKKQCLEVTEVSPHQKCNSTRHTLWRQLDVWGELASHTTFNPPPQFSRLGIQVSLDIYVCLSRILLGGLLYLFFRSVFLKLVCYAHVFPCTNCSSTHSHTRSPLPSEYPSCSPSSPLLSQT